jgi:uncharacterized protein YcbX
MPVVAAFNVTPVKSTALLHPASVELTPSAVVGDRGFMFVHPDGTRFSGSEKAPLLTIGARHDPATDVLALDVPGVGTIRGDAATVGARFPLALYDRTVHARLIGGPFAGAISGWAGFELALARVEAPEHAGGVHPVSLISWASVEDLGTRGGADTMPDPRRFRMTIELDDADPYEEDTWVGRRIKIGRAIVRVPEPIPRCVLTTLHPDTGVKDFPTLEVLATYRRRDKDLVIGVYGDVERPGAIRVGDRVRVLPDRDDPLP